MTSVNELIAKLIDEGKITGEEALTLIEATRHEKEVRIERIYNDWWRYPTYYTIHNDPAISLSNNTSASSTYKLTDNEK